tara:strand:- start:692 stop:1747 length:1056 start_codon:yes stop_codon:yes gene_type:complete
MNFRTYSQIFNFLPPEFLHKLFIKLLQTKILKKKTKFKNLEIKIFGKNFDNPIGLAAGFDKNAEAVEGALNLGFGFLELGTVTPMPQAGNKKPRVFKIPELEAVIQRLGFNNDGVEQFLENLKEVQRENNILGINIGKNKNSDDFISDYRFLYQKLEPFSDYITINISSPNTPGLRDIQEKGNIEKLLRDLSKIKKRKPTLLKLSPDLSPENLDNICNLILKDGFIEGLVLTNTTISRDSLYQKPVKDSWKLSELGGLSGSPLKEKTNLVIKRVFELTKGKIKIIGVGGISTGKDAFEKISLGASLLQLYTSLIYQGPNVVFNILSELSSCLKKKGIKNVSELVGKNISYD